MQNALLLVNKTKLNIHEVAEAVGLTKDCLRRHFIKVGNFPLPAGKIKDSRADAFCAEEIQAWFSLNQTKIAWYRTLRFNYHFLPNILPKEELTHSGKLIHASAIMKKFGCAEKLLVMACESNSFLAPADPSSPVADAHWFEHDVKKWSVARDKAISLRYTIKQIEDRYMATRNVVSRMIKRDNFPGSVNIPFDAKHNYYLRNEVDEFIKIFGHQIFKRSLLIQMTKNRRTSE